MIKSTLIISNKFGLHARPASQFVETADKFSANIRLIHKSHVANGRSILDVMALAAGACEITIELDGDDEEEAMKALKNVIENIESNVDV